MKQMGIPPEVNPDDLQDIVCECGSELWEQAMKLKKMSAIVSPDGQEKIAMVPVLVCKKCGKEL